MSEMAHPKYRPDIDGLRAIAVLSVLGFHAFPSIFKGGYVGVDIFFVISGFLISGILFNSIENGTFSIREFYSRRVRRIFPSLSFILVACFIFGWFALFTDEYVELGKQIAAGVGFASNFLYWKESGYFDLAAETKPLLHLWSLAVEEQFYFFWPLIVFAAFRMRVRFVWLSVLMIGISLWYGKHLISTDPSAAFYFPFSRFWELAFGGLLAWIQTRVLARPFQGQKILQNGASLLGLVLVTVTVFKKEHFFPGCWALLSTTGAVFLIYGDRQAFLNRYILSLKPMIWVGLISYPLYLWHWPLLSFARIIETETPPFALRCGAAVLSIVFAILTYFWVEKPLRQSRKTVLVAWSLVGTMVFLGTLGFVVSLQPSFFPRLANPSPFQDSHRLPAAESCLDAVKPFGKLDKCASHTDHPRIALIGDSHAGHYYSGLLQTDLPVAVLWNGGCPPVGNLEYDRHSCPERWNTMKDFLSSRKNEIRVVLISIYYQMYLLEKDPTGQKNKTFTALQAELGETDGSEEKMALRLQQGLEESISFLENQGFKVGLMLDVPAFPYQPQTCFKNIRPLTFRTRSNECLPLSPIQLERQQRLPLQVISNLQKTHHFKVFNPTEFLCDHQGCSAIHEQGPVYRDDDHLSDLGSLLISKPLTDWIRGLAL